MDGNQIKKCNFCGEELLNDTRRCPYCGSLLTNINEKPASISEANVQENNGTNTVNLERTENIVSEDSYEKADNYNNPYNDLNNSESGEGENDSLNKVDPNNDEIITNYDGQNDLYTNIGLNINQKEKPSLSNGFKVFIVTISSFLPGIGQLIGIIAAIIFMNSERDKDRKSFGVALLASSLVIFVLSFCLYCVLVMALSKK